MAARMKTSVRQQFRKRFGLSKEKQEDRDLLDRYYEQWIVGDKLSWSLTVASSHHYYFAAVATSAVCKLPWPIPMVINCRDCHGSWAAVIITGGYKLSKSIRLVICCRDNWSLRLCQLRCPIQPHVVSTASSKYAPGTQPELFPQTVLIDTEPLLAFIIVNPDLWCQ